MDDLKADRPDLLRWRSLSFGESPLADQSQSYSKPLEYWDALAPGFTGVSV
jgi:hypothetical protein